jgi:hypothetical protein
MPLRDVDIPCTGTPPPGDVNRLLRVADGRIERFLLHARVPGFVPSDYVAAYGVLRALAESPVLRGRQFCEWGSGFGVVTCLAALTEFDACGIEIEGELVEQARQLAADFELPTEFVRGSFIPRGAERRVVTAGEYSWLTTDGDYAYDDLGLSPADMDLVFAYPWPDEEAVTADLFERYAGPGALLATYHGENGFRLRRKVAGKGRKATYKSN